MSGKQSEGDSYSEMDVANGIAILMRPWFWR
jgi:hypothetical protein